MRVLFYGTPEFAVPTLERLLDSQHTVVGVICQPDKPAGRGRKLTPPPVKARALENGLSVLQPNSVKTPEFLAEITALQPDVAVVVAYGKILPRAVLDAPRHGSLNIHGSLLPAYRGAAPIQWAIVNGEPKTGITIMQMDEGLDSGPIVEMEELEILEDDDAISVGNALSLMGAQLMVRVLDRLAADGKLDSTPQDHARATRAPLINREMARIDWTRPHEKIIWAIRGFQPWPAAYTTAKGKELKILGAEACAPSWVPDAAFAEEIVPGTIVEILKGRGFAVRTGDKEGLVLVTRVKPEGRGEMGAFDFLNGGGADVGTVLGA